jgi:hypothetical protein
LDAIPGLLQPATVNNMAVTTTKGKVLKAFMIVFLCLICENDLRTAQNAPVIHSGILHPKSTTLFVVKAAF